MRATTRVLHGDWERFRRANPDTDEDALATEIVVRGRRRLAGEWEEFIGPDVSREDRLEWLRRWIPRLAADIATLGFDLVENRGRAAEAARLEEATYQHDIELKKDVIPELKAEAKTLRAEMRRLESSLRSRGGDPDSIEPALPGDTIYVDDFEQPKFETNESRRKAVVEYFRRRESHRG